jgi:hypothetical protein
MQAFVEKIRHPNLGEELMSGIKVAGGLDHTRSGIAFGRARQFRRDGRSFEEYVDALHADQAMQGWLLDKSFRDYQRQLQRVWHRANIVNRDAAKSEQLCNERRCQRPHGTCPVCGRTNLSLVGHHDHFGDLYSFNRHRTKHGSTNRSAFSHCCRPAKSIGEPIFSEKQNYRLVPNLVVGRRFPKP